jgi:prolyl-tRNA synthetase
VVSDRGLGEGTLEYKGRRDSESQNIAVADVMSFLKAKIGN